MTGDESATAAWVDWRFWLIVKQEWPGWSRQPAHHPSEGYDPIVWRAEDDD